MFLLAFSKISDMDIFWSTITARPAGWDWTMLELWCIASLCANSLCQEWEALLDRYTSVASVQKVGFGQKITDFHRREVLRKKF